MKNNTSNAQNIHQGSMHSHLRHLMMQTLHLLFPRIRTIHVAPVALLIDGDNTSADLIAPILIEAGKFGGVTVRRVYGNWASPTMQRWQTVAPHYGIEPRFCEKLAAGKNAADIALVIDAMDLFHCGNIEHFCLVTSDCDYTPLVRRLCFAGCLVLGIGDAKKTSPALMGACTIFRPIEQLTPPLTPSSKPVAPSPELPHNTLNGTEASTVTVTPVTTTTPKPKPAPQTAVATKSKTVTTQTTATSKQTSYLEELMIKAYEQSIQDQEGEWVVISKLALVFKQLDPTQTYNQREILSLVKTLKSRFEIRQRKKIPEEEVRRRIQPS